MELPVTGIPLVDLAFRLLAEHAYLFTFAATIIENILVAGSFMPGETIVLAAGLIASLSATDSISPVAVFVVAVVGSVIGSNISYVVGRRGGRPLLDKYGHRFFLRERSLRDAEAYFDLHGSKTIFFGRFAPGIKNFGPVLAGTSKMKVAVFEAYTIAGSVVYAATMVMLGYFFGSNFERLLKWVSRAGWVALAVFVLLLGLWWWQRRLRIKRRQASEAALERVSDEGE